MAGLYESRHLDVFWELAAEFLAKLATVTGEG